MGLNPAVVALVLVLLLAVLQALDIGLNPVAVALGALLQVVGLSPAAERLASLELVLSVAGTVAAAARARTAFAKILSERERPGGHGGGGHRHWKMGIGHYGVLTAGHWKMGIGH